MSTSRHFILAAVLAATFASGPVAAQNTGSDREALIMAIRQGDGAKVNGLIASGGKGILNSRGFSGETPLTTAISARNTLFARYIIQNHADPDLANEDGETPLTLAVRMNDAEVIEALAQSGAKLDKGNDYGETPLIIAVQLKRASMIRLLMEKGANPDIRDHRAGFSAREYAQRETRQRQLLKIIEDGAKADAD